MNAQHTSSSPGAPTTTAATKESQGEKFKDCTPCRLMGAATFIGTGIYAFTVKPEPAPPAHQRLNRVRRLMLPLQARAPALFGGVMVGLGLWRLVV